MLREILAALDDKLTPEDLDGIIEEIDEDGSGTIDFDGETYFTSLTFLQIVLITIFFNDRIHGNDDWLNF